MRGNPQDFNRRRYLMIYRSEVRVLAGISARWGELETGVEFFGAWSNKGLPIIQLVIGPGLRAVHGPCRYQQDLDFFRRIHDVIVSEYGIEWIGGGHSHCNLGLRSPSSGDVRQVMGLTRRNNLDRWCEIITTFVDANDHPGTNQIVTQIPAGPNNSLHVQVDAYLYTDPQRGEKVRVPIRVLPGISPFRKELLKSGKLSPADIGEYAVHFTLENIHYESLDSKRACPDLADEVFEVIATQCRELTEEAQEGISFSVLPHSVVVVMPLLNGAAAYIEYGRKPPHEITGIWVRSDHGRRDDLSADFLDRRRVTTLNQIYSLLASQAHKSTKRSRSWSRMKVLVEAATHVATACIGRGRHKE